MSASCPAAAEADYRDEGVRAALRDEALGEAEVRGGGGGEAADDGAHGEDLGGHFSASAARSSARSKLVGGAPSLKCQRTATLFAEATYRPVSLRFR